MNSQDETSSLIIPNLHLMPPTFLYLEIQSFINPGLSDSWYVKDVPKTSETSDLVQKFCKLLLPEMNS
jgi:hypothetical protein